MPSNRFNTPWKVEIVSGYATVLDCLGDPVPELTDIELGWTDTTTGNYHSPEEALERIEFIVKRINSWADLLTALHCIRQFFSSNTVIYEIADTAITTAKERNRQ